MNSSGIGKLGFVCCLAIVSFVFLMFINGCGANKELQKANNELIKLQGENSTMKERIKTLEEENTKLKGENDQFIEEIGTLKRRLNDEGIAATIEEGNLETCKSNLKNIATAVRLYANDNSGYFPVKLDNVCLNPKWGMESIPTCPSGLRDTYSAGYEIAKDWKSFTILCAGKYHTSANVKENFPQYNTIRGMFTGLEKKEQKSETKKEETKTDTKEENKESTKVDGKDALKQAVKVTTSTEEPKEEKKN